MTTGVIPTINRLPYGHHGFDPSEPEPSTRAVVERDTTLPAVDCAAWCSDGQGHTDALHPDDQACISRDVRVDLTAEPLHIYKGKVEGRDFIEVGLLREHDAKTTLVELTHYEHTGFKMTLDEALQLVQAVTLLVSAAKAAPAGVTA